MPTLHIEHAITDLATWQAAFDRFAERRTAAGVIGERIAQPADDRHYIVIDLDFETTDQAMSFLQFLRTQVWTSPETAPGLAGAPRTAILRGSTAGSGPDRRHGPGAVASHPHLTPAPYKPVRGMIG